MAVTERGLWRWLRTAALLLGVAACSRVAEEENATVEPRTAQITARTQEMTILFGGDTAFGESYGDQQKQLLRECGYDYPLAKLKPLMELADFSVLNLETPVCHPLQSPLEGKGAYIHWTHWEQAPATLQAHGVRLVSLGNNHGFDYGIAGLEESFRSLQRHQIEWIGAGTNRAEAVRPWVAELDIAGQRQYLAVLAGFEYQHSYRMRYRYSYATRKQPGMARLEPAILARQINALKARYPGIYIVVFPHWGQNYAWREPKQAEAARRLIDAGADLILGHSAHRFQQIEQYRGRWIVYSLGNFMFNSPGGYAQTHSPPYSLVALLTFRGQAKSLKLYPILSDNNRTGYQPRPLDPAEFDDAVRILRGNSPDLQPRLGEDRAGRHLEWSLDPSSPAR